MPDRKDKSITNVSDPDNPEWTEKDFARARPASELHPEFVARYRGQRGEQKAPKKVQLTVRLDADLVARLKEDGKGWQTRINDFLRRSLDLGSAPADDAPKKKRKVVRPRAQPVRRVGRRAGQPVRKNVA